MIGTLGIDPSTVIQAIKHMANVAPAQNDDGTYNGVAFTFRFAADHYVDGNSAYESEIIHVIILRESYAFVHRQQPRTFVNDVRHTKPKNWVNVGNHSSCWTSSLESAFTDVYFELTQSINDQLVAQGSEPVAPSDIRAYVIISPCDPFVLVKCRIEQKPNDRYLYDMQSITVCDTAIIAK